MTIGARRSSATAIAIRISASEASGESADKNFRK
jgi:hypothetical protein